MMEIYVVVGIVALLVGFAAGFGMGRSGARAAGVAEGRREAEQRLRAAAESIARGQMPAAAPKDSAEGDLYEALRAGWAPRDEERQVALRQALERVGLFLDKSVRAPLAGGTAESDPAELRERMDRALGAIQDLGFFLADVPAGAEGVDLGHLVGQVSREFTADQGVSVRLSMAAGPVRAELNSAAFMDALYLVLHNAARFGGGSTVDLTVVEEDGRSVVRVRDRGEGFGEEAFARAFDPFYSTSPEGLGLGLPHARKVLEGLGGRIELSNVPDGGAQVEISFPAS